jgi:hypothetical protein
MERAAPLTGCCARLRVSVDTVRVTGRKEQDCSEREDVEVKSPKAATWRSYVETTPALRENLFGCRLVTMARMSSEGGSALFLGGMVVRFFATVTSQNSSFDSGR